MKLENDVALDTEGVSITLSSYEALDLAKQLIEKVQYAEAVGILHPIHFTVVSWSPKDAKHKADYSTHVQFRIATGFETKE